MAAHRYIEILAKAGIPGGLVSLIIGKGEVGADVAKEPSTRAVFFTGSTRVGLEIEKTAAKQRILAALEMGGDGVVYVHDFDDLDGAIDTVIQSALITSGQRCSTGRTLLLGQQAESAGFLEALLERVGGLRIGYPTDVDEPFYGTMKLKRDAARVLEYVSEANERGARVLLKPDILRNNDRFISPAIVDLNGVDDWAEDEISGPLLRIQRVDDVIRASDLANKKTLRLIASVVSKEQSVFDDFCARVEYGGVNWNCATTGNSGWGAFGGSACSGNFRPSGYLAADYCVRAQSKILKETARTKTSMPGDR